MDWLESTFTTTATDGIVGPDTQYTVAVWIYRAGGSDRVNALLRDDRTLQRPRSFFRLDNLNTWANIDHGNSNWVGWNGAWRSGTPPATGTWHMIVNTYDGWVDHVYVDGVDRTTGTTPHSMALNQGYPMVVGAGYWGNSTPSWFGFVGSIARLHVWDQGLSYTQLLQQYGQSVSGKILDANNGDAPVAGATATIQVGGADAGPVSVPSDSQGNYTAYAMLHPGDVFTVHATKLNYTPGDSTPPITYDGSVDSFFDVFVEVASISTVNISGTVTDFVTGNPVVGLKLTVTVPDHPGGISRDHGEQAAVYS